ncbi:LysR family transcriptional regulator [Georgenia sp. Z1491]|uniref:LysR family transcriptional regulator n=1 Tax=Georgenia sp. Z1491 TaxID=3416707 RepID=UPI003CF633ED
MAPLDLNLLPTLQALLELRNVSRAAERVGLSQPAVSAALARLRSHYDDELLVRVGRTYELSPLAVELVSAVESALAAVDQAAHPAGGFYPATTTRSFTIACSDFVSTLLVRPLRQVLAEEAPGAVINFVPNTTDVTDALDPTSVDLVISPTGYGIDGERKLVFRDEFVAVVDAHHPLLDLPAPTLRDAAGYPHAIGRFGTNVVTPADRLFDLVGLRPEVVAQVTGLLSLPLLVEGTDLVALVPRMLAERVRPTGRIAIIALPEEHETALVEAMFWHRSTTDDAANSWLRGVVQRACRSLQVIIDDAAPPDAVFAVTDPHDHSPTEDRS